MGEVAWNLQTVINTRVCSHIFAFFLILRLLGYFKNNKFHRMGRYTYASGALFEGGFFMGLWDGAGKFQSASGRVYDGVWKKGVYERYYTNPLDSTRHSARLVLLEINHLGETMKIRSRARENAMFRVEHCGHIPVQPLSLPVAKDE